MKRKFTFLMAALFTLAFLTPPQWVMGQTSIYSESGSSTVSNWTYTNNITGQPVQQKGYWLLQAGNPGDFITTCSYSLSNYTTATFSLEAATYGNGNNPQAIVQVSTDGGSTYSNVTLSGTQPTSTSYNTLTGSISGPFSNTVVVKYSNGITSGKGLRLKNVSLTASGSASGTITISDPSISVDYEEHTYETFDGTFSGITSPDFQIQYYESAETNAATISEPSWIETYAYQNGSGVVDGYCVIDENPGTARYAYFKVYSGTVYSNLVTVTQSAAPTPNIIITGTGIDNNAVSLAYNDTESHAATVTYNNMTDPASNTVSVKLYNDDACTTNFSGNWFSANFVTSSVTSINYNAVANTTPDQRTVYMRVETMNGGSTLVPCNVIAITQAGVPTYTVTYDNNGGTGTMTDANSPYLVGATVTVLANTFTKEHYTFAKWNTQADGNGTDYVATNTFAINANTTLYAQWTPNTHNVTLPAEDIYGTYTMDKSNPVAYNTQVTLTYTPKTGYESYVATWSVNNNAISGNKFNMPDADVEVTVAVTDFSAVFTDGVYYESMETEESFGNMEVVNVTGNQTWEFNSTTEAAYINGYNSGYVENEDWLISPKMAVENGKLHLSFGYMHSYQTGQLSWKWSTTNSVNGTWSDLDFEEETTHNKWYYQEADVETNAPYIYVAFVYDNTNATSAAAYYVYGLEANQYYSVTFNANNINATGTMAAQSIPAGIATALTANTFSVEGKLFTNWNTKADGSGTTYSDGADITITGDSTLYAQWADAYTVTFTTNGILEETRQIAQGHTIGTLPTPTAAYIPSGYNFVGWLTNDYAVSNTAPSSYITSSYVPESNVTLKAVFAEGETTVTYTLVGANNVTEGTYIIGALKSTSATNNFYFATATTSSGAINVNSSSTSISVVNNVRAINSLPSGAVEFLFTGNNSDGFTISTSDAKYLGYSSYSNNKLEFNKADSTFIWKISAKNSPLITNGIYLDYKKSDSEHYLVSENTTNTNCIRGYTSDGSNNIYRAIYLFKKTETSNYSNYRTSLTTNSGALEVASYGISTNGGYKLIASPVYVTPANVNGMTAGDFDLYYFDQSLESKQWRNYEASPFNLEPGKGYLYANSSGVTLSFTGTAYSGNGKIALDSTTTEGRDFAGWNLIGNPYTTSATVNKAYYRLNADGSELNASTESTAVATMEGVFVKAASTTDTATFTAQRGGNQHVVAEATFSVRGSRSAVVDNAIIRFDEGETLEKFMLNPTNTKVYVPQDGNEYAIARSNGQGEMPVNFKAAENGTYTIDFSMENVEFNYLHLIDNKTGANVDLLANPSYSFEAKTTDYASRFRLLFNANNVNDNENEDFAFVSDGNIVITNQGEATLQVIDMLGRIVSTQTVNGNATINAMNANGVYVLRLINGNNVKVQKIVVK